MSPNGKSIPRLTWHRQEDLNLLEGDWRRVQGRYVQFEDGRPKLSSQGEPIVKGDDALQTLEAIPGQSLPAGSSVRFSDRTAFRVLDADGNTIEGSDNSAVLILFNSESNVMRMATEREMQQAASDASRAKEDEPSPATTVDMATTNSVINSGKSIRVPTSRDPSRAAELSHKQVPTASTNAQGMPAAKPTTLITVVGSHEPITHADAGTVAPIQTKPAQPAAPPMVSLPYKCTDE